MSSEEARLESALALSGAASVSAETASLVEVTTTSTETPEEESLTPAESLLRIRETAIETYNSEVAETFKRLHTLANGLDELQRATLVRLDTTTCPRNTIFEHIVQQFVWYDPETDSDQQTLPTERCLGGVCNLGADAENQLWLRKQTIWNRFVEAKRHLEDLNRDRGLKLKQLGELEEQLQTIRQSEEFGGEQSGIELPPPATEDDLAAMLIDPSGLQVPLVQEPVEVRVHDSRTAEDLARERERLVEAIEAGSYDAQLGVNAKGSLDCRTLLPQEMQNDADVWKALLRRYPDQMKYLPRTTLATPQFALQMLDAGGALSQRVSESLPESLRSDPGFILKLVEKSWRSARDTAGPELRNNPDLAIKALRYFDQDVLETVNWMGPAARDNGFVMSTAILMCPPAIKLASDRLRNDRDFVHDVLTASFALCEEATRREMSKSRFAGAANFDWRVSRRENSRFKMASRKDAWGAVQAILENVADGPRNDEAVMTLALLHDGRAMQYASARLRMSRTFVATVIATISDQQYPEHREETMSALCPLLDQTLREDEEIAILSIEASSGRMGMDCWSEKLLSNRDFLIRAMSLCLYRKPLLTAASAGLKNDDQIVMTALVTDGSAIQAASAKLQSDKRFVVKAINASASADNFNETLTLTRHHYGDHLPAWGDTSDDRYFASCRNQIAMGDLADSLRSDRDVALANVEVGGYAKGIAPSVLNEPKFAADAIKWFARKAAYPHLRSRIGERLMAFLPDRVRDNEDVMLIAVKEQGGLSRFVSARLKVDPKFCAKAVAVSENASATIEHLAKSMRDNHDVMEATAKVDADLAVLFASERLKNDELFASTVLNSAADPDRLRSKLARPTVTSQNVDLHRTVGGSGMTAADWWAVVVVVLGALLFGYVFVALPEFKELATGTTLLQGSIAFLLGIGLLFALNQVRVNRRTQGVGSVDLGHPYAANYGADDGSTLHYTRDGELDAMTRGERNPEGDSADVTH